MEFPTLPILITGKIQGESNRKTPFASQTPNIHLSTKNCCHHHYNCHPAHHVYLYKSGICNIYMALNHPTTTSLFVSCNPSTTLRPSSAPKPQIPPTNPPAPAQEKEKKKKRSDDWTWQNSKHLQLQN